MEIQAVFFDMGGTIETFGYTRELRLAATAGIQQRLASAGIHLGLSDEQLLERISSGLAHYKRWSLETLEERPPAEVWEAYILAGLSFDSARLAAIAEDLMLYIETRFYERAMRPEIPQVLAAIRAMGLKIGLISNVNSRGQVPTNLQAYGIIEYFDPIVLSSAYGRRKPDPSIFHYAARLANVPTSACVYVGDRITRDIAGALRSGFGMAVQIRHDFDHGEDDSGAQPSAVIDSMTELLPLLERARQAAPQPARPIRALIFDAGDILYFRPERGRNFDTFLQEQGINGRGALAAEEKHIRHQAYQGKVSQDAYRESILRLYGITAPEMIQRGKSSLEADDNNVVFFDCVAETLRALKQQGFLLGIITDTANAVHTKLNWFERGGFGDVWDSIISSQELGVRKPDPQIYQAALRQLGLQPSQAAFIGHKDYELEGARASGMRTVAFNYDANAGADFYIETFDDLLRVPLFNPPGQPFSSMEAVLFDLGGTLQGSVRRDRREHLEIIAQLMRLINAQGPVDKFSDMLHARFDVYKRWARETMRELPESQLWSQWMLSDWPPALVEPLAVQLNQLFRDAQSKYHIFTDTKDVVLELYRRGYRLGLVSNTTSSVEAPALLEELGIAGCFDVLALSAVVGLRKPDPAILQDCAARMGVPPQRCAYVGNRHDRDLPAARRAGFAAMILLRNPAKPDETIAPEDSPAPDFVIGRLNSLLEIFPPRPAPQPPVVYDASLSSMYARKFPGLADFFEFARRAGFASVELNHKVTSEMLAAVDLRSVRVSSIHEPCPADISVEMLKARDWLVSSTDEANRRAGVQAVRRSIELAGQCGARVVVIHAGQALSDGAPEKKLRALLEAGHGDSDAARELRAAMRAARAEAAPAAFAAVRQSLLELLEVAAPLGVQLGIENRYHYYEFPLPDEMEALLSLAAPQQIGFLLDSGHAAALDRMGFVPASEWLRRFGARIALAHLHDVTGTRDHFAPPTGTVDFAAIAAALPVTAIRTCEFQTFNTPQQVAAGLAHLVQLGCIKPYGE